MPYKLPGGYFERSNPIGSNPIVKNLAITDYTSKWIADTYDASMLYEQVDQGNIYRVPKSGKDLKFIVSIDGSLLKENREQQQSVRLNQVRWVSVMVLRIRADWKPQSITNARQEIEQNHTRYDICLPVEGLHEHGLTIFETISKTFYDTMSQQWPDLLKTYKWLLYKQWDQNYNKKCIFRCPYCEMKRPRTAVLEHNADWGICSNPDCKHKIAVTDFFVGYNKRMGQTSLDLIPNMILNDLERLVLFNEIRTGLESGIDLSEHLFVNDGSLRIDDQVLGRNINSFFRFSHQQGYKLNIVSQEKSGRFYDHIQLIEPLLQDREVFIPPDIYNQSKIQRRGEERIKNRQEVYGFSHNLGIKLFAKYKQGQTLVLNIPTSGPRSVERVKYKELMNLTDIFLTIEKYGLNSDRIKWIEFAHSAVSMSQNEHPALVRRFFGQLP